MILVSRPRRLRGLVLTVRLFFCLLLGLIAPGPGMAQTKATQPPGTINVTDTAEQDAAIAVRIRLILGPVDV